MLKNTAISVETVQTKNSGHSHQTPLYQWKQYTDNLQNTTVLLETVHTDSSRHIHQTQLC